jgi:hypothetical protein
MDYVKQFQDACAAMKKDGTLTQERMTVAWLMFMPKDQAEKAVNTARKLSSRKAEPPSRSGP